MRNIKTFESFNPEENYTVEDKRLERLRNLITPLINLTMFIKDNKDGKLDGIIEDSVERCLDVIPLIRKALKDDITMEELYQLYTDPKNRR